MRLTGFAYAEAFGIIEDGYSWCEPQASEYFDDRPRTSIDMSQFKPCITDDGSYTFFSEEFGQTFHSKFGAKEESIFKYAIPTLLAEKASRGHLQILDICYGLGYNSAAALATIWRSHPACTVEIIALELDRSVPVSAIEHNLLGDWAEPIPQLLTQLVNTEIVESDRLTARLILGDARQTIDRVLATGFIADAIFLDPFSPTACPQLWTIEFIDRVAKCCAPDGIIATYSCASAVRTALVAAGLSVGDSSPVGRKSPGTVASFNAAQLTPLSPQELEHLQTRAAVPYRDPSCTDSMAKIIIRRELEQDECGLETTSQWKKRWRTK
ncbi:MnmC family methyltransferase [Chamaesiphon sp. VAR_69_metabat_338]|uniref:tRNA (5-methylaminomethyl-2-thiouridine)(34)-methyltransferase MnmD n=1 Tax=Chamaesiphon sp. VAR_69_metabat_338 TaxID=2964704 RepID=UPI00286EA869|nr:MnmC family methyltransferase [Chamaesiphon sp. VAR_69_metabat_338]